MFLLHVHSDSVSNGFLGFAEEVLLHGLLDTLKIIPFLFLTYLLMEYLEHKASSKVIGFMKKTDSLGPLAGGLFGVLPQCAFSAVASNLYTARVITLGTLLSVFLSTSDEMLPILISGNVDVKKILFILLYKVGAAIIVGFAFDIAIKLCSKKKREINIDEICEEDNCHCERGILFSALHHTVTVTVFIFIITLIINSMLYFIGEERIAAVVNAVPVLSHFISAVLGLIPGCATSVALSTLGLKEVISVGTMLAGLFANAGVGLLILFRFNKDKKENLFIIISLVVIGFIFGLLADIIPGLRT